MAFLPIFLLLCAASKTIPTFSTTASPSVPGAETSDCSPSNNYDDLIPVRREIYDGGRIIDISHRYTPDMPYWESSEGLGQFLWLAVSMKNGSLANASVMKIPAHGGTHVDSPGHVFDRYCDSGFDVDTLDLEVLNGPALLVDIPTDKNITEHARLILIPRSWSSSLLLTAEVMKFLNIPRGVRRVLFRTLNTDRRLMFKKEFDTSFVGFTMDGTKWLIENTDIKLVGIDYLSVSAYEHAIPSHLLFLESREIILLEGLKLDDVPAGIYNVHCFLQQKTPFPAFLHLLQKKTTQ